MTPKTEALLVDVGSILGRIWALRTGGILGPQVGPLLPGMLPEGRLGGLRFWGAFGRPISGPSILHVLDAAQGTARLLGRPNRALAKRGSVHFGPRSDLIWATCGCAGLDGWSPFYLALLCQKGPNPRLRLGLFHFHQKPRIVQIGHFHSMA